MTTNKQLILQLRNSVARQLLGQCSTFSERGIMYEALWNIVVKFGLLPGTRVCKHVVSNVKVKTRSYLKDFSKDYLDKGFNNGNETGYSDITFETENNEMYVSTSKFFENDKNKNFDDWDLPKLAALEKIHKNIKYYLVFTKDKESFLKIFENSNKNDLFCEEDEKKLKKNIYVYDLNDLEICLQNVVEVMNSYDWNFDKLLEQYFGKVKTLMKWTFHQELCIKQISRINNGEIILLGLKCRSGKSYIMAGHILEKQFKNVLIVTPIPNESIKSLIRMFEETIQFDDYSVTHFKRGVKIPNTDKRIIIASKQYLDRGAIKSLQGIDFDVIYFDENHWGGTTEKSQKIVELYKKNAQLVLLTATYSKSQNEWKVPNSNSFFWDLEDESLCKKNNIDALVSKFGNDVHSIIPKHNLFAEYDEMPILNILSVLFNQHFLTAFKKYTTDDSYGFDMTALFECVNGEFVNEQNIRDLLDYHFGDGIPRKEYKSMMDRITKNYKDTRTSKDFHTQLWFLPYGSGASLNESAISLKKLIEEHKFGKKFAVEIITSENDKSGKQSLPDYIESLEQHYINNKSGLILLLGFKCSMGISLPLADTVVMLNNCESMDMYMQMLMRSMTEHRGKNKKRGFVIDYNQKRVLQTALNVVKNGATVKEDIQKSLNIVRIDEDMSVKDNTKIVDKIYEVYKNSKINKIDIICSRLERLSSVVFDDEDYKKIKEFMRNISKRQETKEKIEVNDEDEKLPDETSVISDNSKEDDKDLSKEEDEEVKIDYSKELLTSIPILTGLITHRQKEIVNILDCLELIEKDENLCSIFISQCEIWWGIKNPNGFIDLLVYLIKKYYLNIINSINNVIEQMKNEITNLLDDKKQLINIINSMLTPKKIEKKAFGEVFTPLKLVEEMLDHIPKEVWSNPDLKWFDPCVGIGNFMVCVYYRLMNGLSTIITDERNRKEHIINNMLFMSEINSKNVFICKTIFGEHCNIHEGNTLDYNSSHKFDIIIGNPPYQDDSGNKGKGHTLWDKFIKKAFTLLNGNGYLAYVHPAGWRQPNHEMLEILKRKQILYLSIHDEKDGVKTFQCNTRYDWYVLENKDCYKNTIIDAQDRKIYNVDISKLNFIPNFMFDEIIQYITGNEKLEIINSESAYECRKKWISKTKTTEFKYPVIYSINRQNNPTFRWSNRNDNGHFGVPKVIFASGATGFISDKNGDYGLTQWAKSIAAAPENHEKIINTLNSPKFKQVVLACSVGKAEINTKVLKMFRKDFFDVFEI